MTDTSEHLLVMTTCPDETVSASLAHDLVEAGCIACANIVSGIRSIYRWKGETESARECLLLMKTTRGRYSDLEREIRARHPYELPELIAVPISAGFDDYLQWVNDSTCGARSG
jgi:periplasmic divalent cation tolerance protein